jgi:hypothetical protein
MPVKRPVWEKERERERERESSSELQQGDHRKDEKKKKRLKYTVCNYGTTTMEHHRTANVW